MGQLLRLRRPPRGGDDCRGLGTQLPETPNDHHSLHFAAQGRKWVASAYTTNANAAPGTHQLRLELLPSAQTPTGQAATYRQARKQLPTTAQTLRARVTEGSWQETFLTAQGFAEQERLWFSTLTLKTFEPSAFEHHTARAHAAGLRARPLSEISDLNREPEQRRLYHLMIGLLADVPFGSAFEPWPFELWKRRVLDDPDFDPSGFFVLLAPKGEWVGACELYHQVEAGQGGLRQGLTGVQPAWRGLGAAWLLKLTASAQAKARGFAWAKTSNHVTNVAILAINDQMGFERSRASIVLSKTAN